jgi:hypothetical protein
MLRRDWLRVIGCLWLALGAAAGARAATNSFFAHDVCADMTEIRNQYGFENDFVGEPDCSKMCSQAVAACQKSVRDAESCQLAFSSDWIAFDSKVDCDGLTGGDLRDCKNGWAADKKTWQTSIKQDRALNVFFCGNKITACQKACTGQ